jgi:hypothetical protein
MTSRGCGENSALAASGGDRIETGSSAMRKGFYVLGKRMADAPQTKLSVNTARDTSGSNPPLSAMN